MRMTSGGILPDRGVRFNHREGSHGQEVVTEKDRPGEGTAEEA